MELPATGIVLAAQKRNQRILSSKWNIINFARFQHK